jgi:hypothetical protein
MICCPECEWLDKEVAKMNKIEGSVPLEVLNKFAEFLNSLPKPVHDFGWNLEHVPEPKDEERINK